MLTMHPFGNWHICKVTCAHTQTYGNAQLCRCLCLHAHSCIHTQTHKGLAHIFTYMHTCPGTDKHMHRHTLTYVPRHLSTLVYAHTKYKYEYLGTVGLVCIQAMCTHICTLTCAHRLHAHGTSHMYMCVQVNTLYNCDLCPKPLYFAIAPSYPGELSGSLTREWVTNATTELFWHFWWITFNTINWNNCFSFN